MIQASVGRTPKLTAVVHRHWKQVQRTYQECNRSTSSGRATLLEMIKRKKSPSACAMVWVVSSDERVNSGASSLKPLRGAKTSLCAASTDSCTSCSQQAVAIFKYQEKTPSRDSTYRNVLPASTSKGKITSRLTTIIARVLLQLRMSAM